MFSLSICFNNHKYNEYFTCVSLKIVQDNKKYCFEKRIELKIKDKHVSINIDIPFRTDIRSGIRTMTEKPLWS